jgi:hypothetical protein
MKRTLFSISIAALGVAFAAVPLAAHHAFTAEFDSQQPVTLHGMVTKVEWTNPHAWINLDVKGEDGQVVAWRVEAGAPNALLRRGRVESREWLERHDARWEETVPGLVGNRLTG